MGRQAARYLARDPVEHATRIGHGCRDTRSDFAAALSIIAARRDLTKADAPWIRSAR